MQKISLNNTLPKVFAGQPGIRSDVWLKDVTFERGKKYLVSAESGGGKSSLCAYLFGYRTDFSGEITFDGTSVRQIDIARWCEIRKREIAYLPQDLRLFPELTGYRTEAEIRRFFDSLGIGGKTDSLVGKMSIGQQQRVAIVRALCQPCDFYLLDEPVSHLDAANNRAIALLIEEEARKTGAGIIATSVGNNLDIAAEEVLKL
mgnify:CR=1 FL=1